MNIDPTIYGYVGDGFIACPSCAEDIAKDAGEREEDEQATQDDYNAAELRPLHSSDDTEPCGETCDCGTEVFAEAEDHGIDGACRSCGYEVPACWAVVTDDHRRIVLARFQTELAAGEHAWELVYGSGDEDGDRYLDAPLKVIETADETYPGIGGRIPGPGEQALPGLATI